MSNRKKNSPQERSSIFEIIHREKLRIKIAGPQIFIGLGLAVFYFCCVPTLLYPLYCLLPTRNLIILVVIVPTIISSTTRIIFNLIMNHIYISKYPYFEQYRIMDKP